MSRHDFPEDPYETFQRHVWMAPFVEDDLGALRARVGDDAVVGRLRPQGVVDVEALRIHPS